MTDAPPRPPRTDTRSRFLAATSDLMRRQGYSGTGLKEVTQAADAPWGSMYHFFPGGKEQLGAEAVAYASALYGEPMADLFRRQADPIRAVRALFANEAKVLEASDFRDGCPITNAAGDVASTVEAVREACSAGYAHWEAIIASGFRDAGHAPAKAAACAAFVLSTLEGAILLSRTHRSTAPLKASAQLTEAGLRAFLAG